MGRAEPELEPDTLPVPPVPIAVSNRRVELPAVPTFELPPSEPGVHDVRELRVRGRRLLGTQITVTGYITWIYDCVKALARPGVGVAEIRRQIDENPGLCERPKFYLGASPTTPPEQALWVVGVPRPANKREQLALKPEQLRARPPVPRLAIGELVAVTGTFALRSPHGEQHSEGLLVYQQLVHRAPSVQRRTATVAAVPPVAAPGPPVSTTPPLRAVVPKWKRNESIDHYERCVHVLEAGRIDDAITECRAALAMWKGNHLAWYALGNAYATRDHWRLAEGAYDQAARLRPDQAMYQLYDGLARFEAAVREARDDRARQREPSPAAELRAIAHDAPAAGLVWKPFRLAMALSRGLPGPTRLERARQALAAAAKLAPGLAAAHYHLGRTCREQEDAKAAAAAFTRAIQADPSQADAYIALIELYRAWDYSDQAIVVAREGLSRVEGAAVWDLWYELGMAQGAKRRDAEALAAFSNAIRGGHVQARFQRGQIYFRRKALANARRDLESFVASAGPSLGLAKQIAGGLLIEIARQLTPPDPDVEVRRNIERP